MPTHDQLGSQERVQIVRLEALRPTISFGIDHFTARFPGGFLLALGLVAAKCAEKKRSARPTREWEVAEDTLTVNFGERLTHGFDAHPLAGQAFYFPKPTNEETLIVGRLPANDVSIPDSSVSERHCGLRVLSDHLVVTDLNSTNGTWANFKALMPGLPSQVRNEQLLTVGRYSFQFFCSKSMFLSLRLLGEL